MTSTAHPLEGLESSYARALYRPMGFGDADFGKPLIAVVNSWSQLAAGHAHLREVGEAVREGAAAAGGMAVEFNTVAACDGIAQGAGMRYILPSREAIAASAELMLKAHSFQGAVFIASCDKAIPGMLMAAARCDLPSLFVTGGYMPRACFDDRPRGASDIKEAIGAFKAGKVSEALFREIERKTCASPGACNMMGTANTMAAIVEALGLSREENTTTAATSSALLEHARESGRRAVEAVGAGRAFRRVVEGANLENAVRLALAIGGSTNMVLHILALAHELGLPLALDDFDRLSRQTPLLARFKPSAECFLEDFERAGGVHAVMKELRPLLRAEAIDARGRTLDERLRGVMVRSRSRRLRSGLV